MANDKMYETCIDLRKFAELDGTEWGETAQRLIDIWETRTLLSNKLVKALETEINDWLVDVKNNAQLVEQEVTTTHKVVDLVWN